MKIHFSILNEGSIADELAIRLPRWLDEVRDKHTVYFESSKLRPIENNRNDIVKRFLESDSDYLLQIDCDNVPAHNPLKLVDLNLDVVSCPVWIYQHKLVLNIYKYDKNDEYLIPVDYEKNKDSGLIEIDATGTGVILCSRAVLERLERPFERIYDKIYGVEIKGLDLAFSEKVKKAGFKIYTHLDYISKHCKSIDLSVFRNNFN